MGWLGPIFGIFHDLESLQLLATHLLYSYHSWNNMGVNLCPWILLLRQNSNPPPEKSKTVSKYKHVFQAMSYFYTTYYGIVGTFMIWNYGIWSDFNHSCFLALENGCMTKVVKYQKKEAIFLNYHLCWIKFDFL